MALDPETRDQLIEHIVGLCKQGLNLVASGEQSEPFP